MRKILFFLSVLSLTAAWLIGCGSSSKPVTPPPNTQTTTFAFMQEVGSGSYLFSPMIGTFSTTSGTTTFAAAAVKDSSNQPVEAEFYSIYLSSDSKLATLDLYGGLDGTTDQWDIWVAPADGSTNPTPVTNDTNGNRVPQLSPDKTRVVFSSDRYNDAIADYAWSVVSRKTDGSDEVVLPLPPGAYNTWAPTYSPDGSQIAVEGWGYDETNTFFDGIWVMASADGSSPLMLTNPYILDTCDCYDETPAYSPDGTKIVFGRDVWDAGTSTEIEDIYIMNADGTGATKLTDSTSANYDPMIITIAGGSTKILFSSNRTNTADTTGAYFDLYSMNLDGSGVTQLTSNTEYDSFSGGWYEFGSAAAQQVMRHTTHHRLTAGHHRGLKVRW